MSTIIPTESLKFTEARSGLSALLDRVFQRKTRVRLYKGSTPVAAIVSIDDLDRLEKYDRERDAAFVRMARIGEGFLDVSDEELEMRINETTARVRRELWAEHQATAKS